MSIYKNPQPYLMVVAMKRIYEFFRDRKGTAVEQAVLIGGALAVVAGAAVMIKHQADNANSLGDTARSKAENKINDL